MRTITVRIKDYDCGCTFSLLTEKVILLMKIHFTGNVPAMQLSLLVSNDGVYVMFRFRFCVNSDSVSILLILFTIRRRSSLRCCSVKKDVPKNFKKFTWKHLRWSLFLNQLTIKLFFFCNNSKTHFILGFYTWSFINSWPWGCSNITNGLIFGRNIVLVYFFKQLFTDDLKDADSTLTKVHCVKKEKTPWPGKTPCFLVFSPNTGKCGPEKTPYLDTFHTKPCKSIDIGHGFPGVYVLVK